MPAESHNFYAPPGRDYGAYESKPGPFDRVHPAQRTTEYGRERFEFFAGEHDLVLVCERHPNPGYALLHRLQPSDTGALAKQDGIDATFQTDIATREGPKSLRVEYVSDGRRNAKSSRFKVTVDGTPLAGSAADPFEQLKKARTVLWVWAAFLGLKAVSSGVAQYFFVRETGDTEALIAAAVSSFIYIVPTALMTAAGFWFRRHPERALKLGMTIGAFDIIDVLSVLFLSGITTVGGVVGGTVIRGYFWYQLLRVYNALKQRRAEAALQS